MEPKQITRINAVSKHFYGFQQIHLVSGKRLQANNFICVFFFFLKVGFRLKYAYL